MGEYKTPGVYIKEKNAFGNSVVEVETAIPVFIGLTEKAQDGTTSLLNKPMRISSMTEFNNYFGGAPTPKFTLSIEEIKGDDESNYLICLPDKKKETALKVKAPTTIYTLYYHMVLFFANGGGTCYVVSIGDYKTGSLKKSIINDNVFPELKKVQDITMLVVPEALQVEEWDGIYTNLLGLCDSKKYFVLLDVPMKGDETEKDPATYFRGKIGSNNLQFAAAYYPWLDTSVLSDNDITQDNIVWENQPTLSPFFDWTPPKKDDKFPLDKYVSGLLDQKKKEEAAEKKDKVLLDNIDKELHNALLQNWPEYSLMVKKVKDYLNLLPPSAAMAGVYTMVDNTRGVWKAPANVSVNYVNKPAIPITNADQEELNMPMSGKAINAIRSFPGEGIKVWGARTLDGNSLDWRYINVRRTMTFLEQSVKNAARAYVFEPNDANTWINMKCMIESFLRSVWKRGGLAGATPEDAYSVHVGLGDTMTPEDILEGIMRITVLVAISHPAEFIEITFQQQMQKS